ncbi:MAG TPA: protein kinase [Kofleriaceae bacterium]|nr:protein kinase [Kofleriaceae bacterium]
MECPDDNVLGAYVTRRLPDRERERVDEHLASCDACLTITCAAASDDRAPAEPDRTSVGRYVLVEMIGRGGMGEVYVAHDPQLDRKIALKLVRSQRFEQADVRARLSREARAMAQVRHANVAAVYDAGELEGGVFIAMELVDGETLNRWLDDDSRGWREIVRTFAAAGAGLVAAHAAGLVHRDFKPDNVLVERGGRVVVTDFGLAALPDAPTPDPDRVDASHDATNLATRAGSLLGTPRYMSPEQFRGEPTDASTDQFSFAVALYEALYDVLPFGEATSVEALAAAVIAGVVRPRPAGSAIPRRIHAILARALSRTRTTRFPAMAAMLRELDRAAKPRWPAVAIAGGAVAVAATAFVAWPHGTAATTATTTAASAIANVLAAATPQKLPRPPDGGRTPLFIERFKNHTGDAHLDDTLDATVAAVLQSSTQIDPYGGAELDAAAQRAGGDPTNVDALVGLLAASGDNRPMVLVHGSIDKRATGGYVVTLDARDRGAPLTRFSASRDVAAIGDVLPATKQLAGDLLVSIGDAPLPPRTLDAVLSKSLRAIHAWVDGEHHAMNDDQRGAADRFNTAVETDPDFAEARAALGNTLYNISEQPAAIAQLERAFQAADTIPERQRLTLVGDYYGVVGRYSESIMAYQQLLTKWPGDARTIINLTSVALDSGSWPLALEAARDAAKRRGTLEVVKRNLVIAEMGNELIADAHRDAAELLASSHEASGTSITLLASSAALLGKRDESVDALAKLAAIDPGRRPRATADFALYEGRLDDAIAALRDSKQPIDQLTVARVLLRRGDRSGAIAAATAGMSETGSLDAYFARRVLVAAGKPAGVAETARAWSTSAETDRRMFGKLLEGDLALAAHRWQTAIDAYGEAGRIGTSWLVHARLGSAMLGAGKLADAQRELAWCLDHRGQGAILLGPSLELLPEVMLELARAKDAAHAKPDEIRAAYRAVVELAPAAQHDPVTAEAQRRLVAL